MTEYRTQVLGSGKRLSQGPPERLPDVELLDLTAKWQDRLRLMHWDIEVGYVPACKMGGDRQGECQYHTETRTAKILLIDPATADDEDWPWDAAERTIIHELLHLLFAAIWDEHDEQRKRDTEAVIHVLSGALIECEEKVEHLQGVLRSWEDTSKPCGETASDSLASRFARFKKAAY